MSEHESPKKYHFYVDGVRFETEHQYRTGAQIKEIAKVTPTYQLFEETQGDHPDKPIPDAETVDLHGEPKHFFAVPPATFGTQ